MRVEHVVTRTYWNDSDAVDDHSDAIAGVELHPGEQVVGVAHSASDSDAWRGSVYSTVVIIRGPGDDQ